SDRSFRAQRFSYILPFSIALLSLFILLPQSAEATPQANTRYVAKSGSNSGTCSTSGTACMTVQYAVDQAVAGDAIYIAAGTYTSVTLRTGTYQQVYISKTLSLQGGYTTTDNFAKSNPVANPTVLDAQGGGRVVYFNGVAGSVSNLSVQNGNFAGGDGGGIYASNALTLTDVTVMSNTASNNGGGVYANTVATLNGGRFQNNTATTLDGGGLNVRSRLVLRVTQFFSNTAGGNGGGLYLVNGINSSVQQARFRGNSAGDEGGGLFSINSAYVQLNANQITDNGAVNGGGGLYAATDNILALDNNLFAANTSTLGAAEIEIGGSGGPSVLIGRHNTFAAASVGSGIAVNLGADVPGDRLVLTNTLFYGYNLALQTGPNAATIIAKAVLFDSVTTQTQNNAGVISVTTIYSGSAAFVNASARNYHLQPGSAAINAGINAGVTTDIDGQTRPFNGLYDIGYDEYVIYKIYLPLALKDF
ncbi:MAG TPA: choice-of-anchor Q domain-containing protein, partial [Anaerolineae bacterium]|nr:choice-of-anchor Q domain-containing protein [Anaerolineae bacterium]